LEKANDEYNGLVDEFEEVQEKFEAISYLNKELEKKKEAA